MMAGIGIKLVYNTGAPLLVIGLLSVICVMGFWFRDVIHESMGGYTTHKWIARFDGEWAGLFFQKSCFLPLFLAHCFM